MRFTLIALGILAVVAIIAGVVANNTLEQSHAEAPPPQVSEITVAPTQLPPTLNAEANKLFLDTNAAKPDVKTLPSGLQYRVLAAGEGKTPTPADVVVVTYSGHLIDGTVFDQTPPGQTATFVAGELIPGWVEALTSMKEGDEWEIVLPSELGYGPRGAGGVIPPDQTLVFTMKLVSVE